MTMLGIVLGNILKDDHAFGVVRDREECLEELYSLTFAKNCFVTLRKLSLVENES